MKAITKQTKDKILTHMRACDWPYGMDPVSIEEADNDHIEDFDHNNGHIMVKVVLADGSANHIIVVEDV